VFPDLVVKDDTLTAPEQTLLIEAARAGVPLTLRIAEFSFEEARKALEGTGPQDLDPRTVENLIRALQEEGVPADALEHPDISEYLSWRTRMAFEDRVGHEGHALEVQAERDRVLEKAIAFLDGAHTQAELFAAVEAAAAAAGAQVVAASAGSGR
jgi:hypothetical protein